MCYLSLLEQGLANYGLTANPTHHTFFYGHKLKKSFYIFKCLEKNEKNDISWHVKII